MCIDTVDKAEARPYPEALFSGYVNFELFTYHTDGHARVQHLLLADEREKSDISQYVDDRDQSAGNAHCFR